MRYILLVAMREFAENARTKGFWIGILAFPVLLTVVFKVMPLLEKATPTRHFVLVDRSGLFEGAVDQGIDRLHGRDVLRAIAKYAQSNSKLQPEKEQIDLESVPAASLEDMIEEVASKDPRNLDKVVSAGPDAILTGMKPFLRDGAPPFEEPRRRYVRASLPDGIDRDAELGDLANSLKPFLTGQEPFLHEGEEVELFGAVLIPEDVLELVHGKNAIAAIGGKGGVQYWAANLYDEDLIDSIEGVLNGEVRRLGYLDRGVDTGKVEEVQALRVPIASLNPKKAAGKEQVSLADRLRQWSPVGFVYLLYVGIMVISQMLLNNTVEEKSNRIIEVLLSSVTPGELMFGKLIGIAAVGLTMIVTWILSLVGVLAYHAGPEAELATQLLQVLRNSNLLPAFAAYFFIGYTMFAGIFLAIGSVCNTLKDAQNMMGPVMMIMIVPLITMAFIPKDPHGTLAQIISWIPIYSPFAMMNRAAADPPQSEVIGTFVMMIASTVLILWLSGRIFRMGILRTGQPPKLVELWRMVRG